MLRFDVTLKTFLQWNSEKITEMIYKSILCVVIVICKQMQVSILDNWANNRVTTYTDTHEHTHTHTHTCASIEYQQETIFNIKWKIPTNSNFAQLGSLAVRTSHCRLKTNKTRSSANFGKYYTKLSVRSDTSSCTEVYDVFVREGSIVLSQNGSVQ